MPARSAPSAKILTLRLCTDVHLGSLRWTPTRSTALTDHVRCDLAGERLTVPAVQEDGGAPAAAPASTSRQRSPMMSSTIEAEVEERRCIEQECRAAASGTRSRRRRRACRPVPGRAPASRRCVILRSTFDARSSRGRRRAGWSPSPARTRAREVLARLRGTLGKLARIRASARERRQ